MSRQDPGATTGVADYPPPALRCVCGHLAGVHDLRGRCSTVTIVCECACRRYQPDELAEVGR